MIDITIRINDRAFNITRDPFQFVVGENPLPDKKTGKIKWTVYHYFRTLKGVADYLVEKGIEQSEAQTLLELQADIKTMQRTVLVDIQNEIFRQEA